MVAFLLNRILNVQVSDTSKVHSNFEAGLQSF